MRGDGWAPGQTRVSPELAGWRELGMHGGDSRAVGAGWVATSPVLQMGSCAAAVASELRGAELRRSDRGRGCGTEEQEEPRCAAR